MLVYLINKGQFLDTQSSEAKDYDSHAKMKWSRQQKLKLSPETLCKGPAAVLIPFVEEVFKLQFYDKPEYDNLTKILNDQARLLGSNNSFAPALSRCLSPQVKSSKNLACISNFAFQGQA